MTTPFFLPLPPSWPHLPGVTAFFTTRHGGVSHGPYAALNVGIHVGDDPQAVYENRRRILGRFTMAAALCIANQVHGRHCLTVTAPLPFPPPDADALVTAKPGLLVGVVTADCAPLLLADADARVVGTIHAGWRGALAGVVESGIDAMVALGARRQHIQALIGPCLGWDNYEVGEDFPAPFLAQDARFSRLFRPSPHTPGKHLFDLPGLVGQQLIDNGIPKGNTHHTGVCTYEREADFFSHRRSGGSCGRQLAGIALS